LLLLLFYLPLASVVVVLKPTHIPVYLPLFLGASVIASIIGAIVAAVVVFVFLIRIITVAVITTIT
jgi:hypothetical protein